MKANLRIINTQSHEIREQELLPNATKIAIGRHPASDVHLVSSHISKEHAVILRQPNGFVIVDKSSNGTLLNKVRLEKEKPTLLKTGDTIILGEYQLVITIELDNIVAPPLRPPPPPLPKPSNVVIAKANIESNRATPVLDSLSNDSPKNDSPKGPNNLLPTNSSSIDLLAKGVADSNSPNVSDFVPTSFEDVIRGMELGEESSYLIFVGGERDGQRIELLGSISEIFVGSTPNAQVQIKHSAIAAQHAKIRLDWAGITVYDLQSQTGVFVNGLRINGSRKLHNGDEISFGVPLSRGGVKLILYDRNSISTENWGGLLPPVVIKDESAEPVSINKVTIDAANIDPTNDPTNAKSADISDKKKETSLASKSEKKTTSNAADKEKNIAKNIIEAAPAVTNKSTSTANAASAAPDSEDKSSIIKNFDASKLLGRVVYNGIRVSDILLALGLLVFALFFISIALSFL
jgi:pSer/pThr/pTyr-binding forkhead associated (FHA) protein